MSVHLSLLFGMLFVKLPHTTISNKVALIKALLTLFWEFLRGILEMIIFFFSEELEVIILICSTDYVCDCCAAVRSHN